jgi:hypothetical protein
MIRIVRRIDRGWDSRGLRELGLILLKRVSFRGCMGGLFQ